MCAGKFSGVWFGQELHEAAQSVLNHLLDMVEPKSGTIGGGDAFLESPFEGSKGCGPTRPVVRNCDRKGWLRSFPDFMDKYDVPGTGFRRIRNKVVDDDANLDGTERPLKPATINLDVDMYSTRSP